MLNKDSNLSMQANMFTMEVAILQYYGVEACQAWLFKKLVRDKDEECSICVRLRELRFNKFFFDSIQ